MRISDWSSDVCSSDLKYYILDLQPENSFVRHAVEQGFTVFLVSWRNPLTSDSDGIDNATWADYLQHGVRSEEHTSELQSLMRNSYAVFCLKKKKKQYNK